MYYIIIIITILKVGVIIGMQSIIVPSLRSILARFLSEEDRGIE